MSQGDIFRELSWRGLVYQTTDEDGAFLAARSRTVYAGFDPTADSLHVGHLVALTVLRRFQQAGHRPIALVGGATGMIGDPSGKSEERNLLSVETLRANVAAIQVQMERLLDFSPGSASALLVNNFDWMSGYSYLNFLRDVGKNFPVNVMLAKDSVKARLAGESGLSYTEFSYMLLQAYDFVHLHRAFGCEVQLGGSDQWGNITAGIDLGRRMGTAQLHGLTCPLLTTSTGVKMGKTEKGAVWLSPERTRPYEFFQYWLNVADDDVDKCLKFFTDLSAEEIAALAAQRASDPGRRASQRRLAQELTRIVHGPEALARVQRATAVFFGGAEIRSFTDDELREIFADVPSCEFPRAALAGEGLGLSDALHAARLAASKTEARRTIDQGGAYVNNVAQPDVNARLRTEHLASPSMIVLRSGKKKYALLRFVD